MSACDVVWIDGGIEMASFAVVLKDDGVGTVASVALLGSVGAKMKACGEEH